MQQRSREHLAVLGIGGIRRRDNRGAEQKPRATASLRHCGSGLLDSRRGRAWGGSGRKKTWNKMTKEMPRPLVERVSEQTPWEHKWYLENKTRAFLPFCPRSTFLLALFFPYGKKARLEDKGEPKTLMASPALGSLNHELCLLIGLISMNNVLVFHSAQISLPKAWELAHRQTGPLLHLDLCLFSWFSISRGYQLNLYYIPQAVSVCVTHTQKTYLTGTRL